MYDEPVGDVYENVPGSDLSVPDRVYPAPGGDVYNGVPGNDLGVPERSYDSKLRDDVYSGVPGPDLGVPGRSYNQNLNDDVYENTPNFGNQLESSRVYDETSLVSSRGELRSPENNFGQPPGTVYPPVRRQTAQGELGRIYPVTSGDFIIDKPLNLGNEKPADQYNVSLGDFNPEDYPEQ